jgi:putative PIN family toxin of toxin-antitoxin system
VIRAVLDTNVLASGFASPLGTTGQLLQAWSKRQFELLYSEQILLELARTFEQPYFARRLTAAQRHANLTLVREEAALASITTPVSGVATHPEDDLILAAAVSARVDFLVTGDRQMQTLGSYGGVRIVSPRQFAEVLSQPRDQ